MPLLPHDVTAILVFSLSPQNLPEMPIWRPFSELDIENAAQAFHVGKSLPVASDLVYAGDEAI